jgi:hypothetical protein
MYGTFKQLWGNRFARKGVGEAMATPPGDHLRVPALTFRGPRVTPLCLYNVDLDAPAPVRAKAGPGKPRGGSDPVPSAAVAEEPLMQSLKKTPGEWTMQ